MAESNGGLLDYREMHYARMWLKKIYKSRTVMLIMGVAAIAISLGLAVITALLMHSSTLFAWVGYPAVAFFAILGILFLLISFADKPIIRKQKTTITGVLTRKTIYLPERPNVEIFYVDNTQVLWPTGGEQLCYSALDSNVTIDGVMIHPVKNKKLSVLFANENNASDVNSANTSLIVLNYRDTINISALLENYGLNYFKDRYWIEYKKNCLWMFPLTAATVWFIFSGPYLWWSMALLIFTLVVIPGLIVIFENRLDGLFGTNNNYCSASHLDRLSGKKI